MLCAGDLMPRYQDGLTLIPAWLNNYIHYEVWDKITYPFQYLNGYPFLKFNGCKIGG